MVVVVGFTEGLNVVEPVIFVVGDHAYVVGVTGFVKVRFQFWSVPASPPPVSPAFIVNIPGVEHAKKAVQAAAPPWGIYVFENGAAPLFIAMVAEGVKVVLMKLSPELPFPLINCIDTPQGFVRYTITSESQVWVIFKLIDVNEYPAFNPVGVKDELA